MEVCLPMGTPYGYGGGFSHAQASVQPAGTGSPWDAGQPSDLWQMQQQASRKRGWEESADNPEDGRAVRRRAEGETPSISFVASGLHGVPATAGGGAAEGGPAIGGMQLDAYQVHPGAPGGGVVEGQFVGGQRAPLAAHHAYLREQQPLNAFQVLMSAAPIKVDGIVCMSCRTTEARPTAPCFHCGRHICRPCLRQCARCAEGFCSHCATVNYEGPYEQDMCFGCNLGP